MRDGLPVRGAVRPADRGDPGAGRATAPAPGGRTHAAHRRVRGLPPPRPAPAASCAARAVPGRRAGTVRPPQRPARPAAPGRRRDGGPRPCGAPAGAAARPGAGARAAPRHRRHAHRLRTDRKSTRLNSSHVKISYAVFCLKKKKKIKFFSSFIKKKKKKTTTYI